MVGSGGTRLSDSPLRRPLDAAMMDVINSPAWQETLTQYFGSSAKQS